MTKKDLHPSVIKFKQFVKKHPDMIKDVRQKKTSWQELYEDWYLLGEDDPRWDIYRTGLSKQNIESEDKNDSLNTNLAFMNNIINTVKKMDMNQVQSYISQLHDALGTAQQLLTQFQSENNSNENHQGNDKRSNPFSFRKD